MRLYGQVLADISHEYSEILGSIKPQGAAAQQFSANLIALVADTPEKIERARLLMRELLDNRERAQTAGNWYLKPFLESLREPMAQRIGWPE